MNTYLEEALKQLKTLNETEEPTSVNHVDPNMSSEDFYDDLCNYWNVTKYGEDEQYKYIYPVGEKIKHLPDVYDYIFEELGIKNFMKLTGHTGKLVAPASYGFHSYSGSKPIYTDEPAEYDLPDEEEAYELYAKELAKLFAKYNNIPEDECLNNENLIKALSKDVYENGDGQRVHDYDIYQAWLDDDD